MLIPTKISSPLQKRSQKNYRHIKITEKWTGIKKTWISITFGYSKQSFGSKSMGVYHLDVDPGLAVGPFMGVCAKYVFWTVLV